MAVGSLGVVEAVRARRGERGRGGGGGAGEGAVTMRVRCRLTACPGSHHNPKQAGLESFKGANLKLFKLATVDKKLCSHRGRSRGERGEHSGSESESSRGARKNHRGRRKRSGSYKLVCGISFTLTEQPKQLIFRLRLMSSGERCSVSRVEGRAGCKRRRSESPATSTLAQRRSPSLSPP